MIKIKNKKMIIVFGFIVLAFFGIFIKMNYSVDTYLLFASTNLDYVQEYLRSGRLITVFLFKFLQFLRLSPEAMYLVSFIIGIICATFSIYVLYSIFKKYIKNDIINAVISSIIIINPFVIELWLFIEMGIMMFSILACVLAYRFLDCFLENHQKKNICYSIIFMIFAMFSYQGTVAIFVALSAISILIHSNNFKSFIKNNLICLSCYIIPTIVNFIVVMCVGNNRIGVKNDLIQTINFIIIATKEQLFKGFGLYPTWLFIILHICSFAIVIFYIFKEKNNISQKLKNFLKLVYIIALTYFFTIATIIPQNVGSAVMFPRNSYAYGSIIGLVFAFAIICLNIDEKLKYKNKIIAVVSIILLLMQIVQFNVIGINRYIVNYMDQYIILQVNNKIHNYEESTGNKIKNIAIYNKENSTIFYKEINDMINVSAINEEMSRKALIVLFMHRDLNNENQNNEIYNKYFKNNNWKMFNIDQIVLEGDTIHWYLY